MTSRYSGAVLAGGGSSRFGADKARFVYRGKPLLQWALEGLADAQERFIIANRDYAEFEVPVYRDLLPGSGSLSGLHTALACARHDWVAVTACDMPLLTEDYWRFLADRRDGTRLVVPKDAAGRLEPLAALYHRALLPALEGYLAGGGASLQRIAREAGARVVAWDALQERFGPQLFTNANRPEDLPEDAYR